MTDTERYLAVMMEDLAFRIQAMASDVLRRGIVALGSQESIGETYGRINDAVVGTHRAIIAMRRGDSAKAEEWLNGIKWEPQ